MSTDLLVVGGGPAGLAAIRGFRRHHGRRDATLVTDEDTLPYNRPALSKEFLRGEIGHAGLPIEAPDFYHDVNVRRGVPVVALNPAAHTAVLADGIEIRYTSCVLATGSEPRPLPVPGGDDPRIYLLRSLASAQRLRSAAQGARSAIVLGSGFIGCEVAVSLARRGLAVTLVSQEHQPQRSRLGDVAGARFAGWLRDEHIETIMGTEVIGIDDGVSVRMSGRDPVSADIVVAGGGITPRVEIARLAGLRIDQGRVLVDDHMRSTVDGVYVAGDAALAINRSAGRRLAVEHWGEALRMGEIAGATAAGAEDSWDEVPGFWTQIGDRTVKYVAWGDGFETAHVVDHSDDAFTIWYSTDGHVVGALTYNADADYEAATELIKARAPVPAR